MTNGLSKHVARFRHYDTTPLSHYRHCWADAFYNLVTNAAHAPTPGKTTHRLAAGAVATTKGHCFYGSATNNPVDYFMKPTDAHCWIEDSDGRIWDHIHPEWARFGVSVPPEGVDIAGLTAAEIKRKHNLCYTRTADLAIAYIYQYAFEDYMPLCPRYDGEVAMTVSPGYHDFTMAPPALKPITICTERRKRFNDWRTKDMDFDRLIDGDIRTLERWRTFYTQPLDRSRFSPVVTFYGADRDATTARMMLDDNHETNIYLSEGVAIGYLLRMKNLARVALDARGLDRLMRMKASAKSMMSSIGEMMV